MANRRDVVAEQLSALADDLEALWRAATKDPKAEARRERTWKIISAGTAAISTVVARQVLSRVWPILTGESPPTTPPPKPPRQEERQREQTTAGASGS